MREKIGNRLSLKIMLEKTHIEKLNKIMEDQNINEETLFIKAQELFKTKNMQTDNYNPKFTDINKAMITVYDIKIGFTPYEELAMLSSKFRLTRVQFIREVLLSYLENDETIDETIDKNEQTVG